MLDAKRLYISLFKDREDKEIYYDYLRVLALFMVIGVHAVGSIEQYYPENVFSNWFIKILESINSLGVPIFFEISGMFLLNKTYNNIFEFYKKRFISVVVPFLIYAVIYVIYFEGIENGNFSSIIPQYFIRIFTNNVHPTHWFVYAILGLYLCTPFLAKMFQAMTDKEVVFLLLGLLFILIFDTYLGKYSIEIFDSNIIFLKGNTFAYISGYCIRRLSKNQKFPGRIFTFKWIIALMGIILMISNISIAKYLIIFSLIINKKMQKFFLQKIVKLISNYSYSIYLIHAASLSLILKLNKEWTNYYVMKTLLLYITVFLVSFIIVVVIDNIITKKIQRYLTNF